MAKAVTVTIFGHKTLDKKFLKLGKASQRRVLSKSFDATAKKTIKPILKSQLPSRSVEPPLWKAEAGVGEKMLSHTGKPGSLKNKLLVKNTKRSRVNIGKVVMMPTRDRLGIPEDYPFYYPAAIEYGVKFNKFMGKPQPAKRIFRNVFTTSRGPILNRLHSEARKQMKMEASRLRKMV